MYFNHPDYLGSSRLRMTVTGAVHEGCYYLSFGETSCSGDDPSPIHFTGQEEDTFEAGLYYYKARHYNPSFGRFMSPDPTGIFLGNLNDPQQLNLGSYVRNNPINLTDPSGLQCDDFGDDCCDICIIFPPIGIGGGGGGRIGPQPPLHIPPDVGTSPNPPSGTLASDDPFGGETNGIPNGLQIPTLDLPGLLLPGNPGCEFGSCAGANSFDGGELSEGLGILCAAQPWTCELFAISVTVYGVAILAHHYGVDAAAVNALRPIFQAKGGPQNVADTGIMQEVYDMIAAGQAKTVCEALQILYDSATGVRRNKIKATQKAKGCRGH